MNMRCLIWSDTWKSDSKCTKRVFRLSYALKKRRFSFNTCLWPDSNSALARVQNTFLTCTDIFRKKLNMHCLIWFAAWQRWMDCVSFNFGESLCQGTKLHSIKTNWGEFEVTEHQHSAEWWNKSAHPGILHRKHPRLESNWHLQQIAGLIFKLESQDLWNPHLFNTGTITHRQCWQVANPIKVSWSHARVWLEKWQIIQLQK